MAEVKPKGPNDAQNSVNVPGSWVDELEHLAEAMSQPGIAITKADVHRAALRRGLDAMAAEHKAHPPSRAKR
jgi:hypothetical protein